MSDSLVNEIDCNDDMSEEEIEIVKPGDLKVKSEDSIGNKKRKRSLSSKVWNSFDLVEKDGIEKAKCTTCGKEYQYDNKKGGTSTMKRHAEKCSKARERGIGQFVLSQANGGNMGIRTHKLDQAVFREKITSSIIKHNLPFDVVEYEGFRDVCSYLNVDVTHISRNTAKADILKLYKKQKELVSKKLLSTPGKICLTSDLWTSVTTYGYLCLTSHFIDHDWVLQKLVLNFCHMPPPHSGREIAEKLFSILADWGIEEKIFSITLDNAASNDKCVEEMKDRLLSLKDTLYSSGAYFHIRCCAHILNLIVKEGLKIVDMALEKIRESFKYLKGSQVRKKKFLETVERLEMTQNRGLRQDVPTRWNSTFLMLDSCLVYQKVFVHLKVIDDNYSDCPTVDEWKQIEVISKFLKAFYKVTNLFSGTKYPTSNLYFQEIWKVQIILNVECNSSNGFIKDMAAKMQTKFDKYWSTFNPILVIAIVLDPRRKLSFVEFSYQKLYPLSYKRHVKDVHDKLDALYQEYASCKSTELMSTTMANMGPMVGEDYTFDRDDELMGEHLEGFETFENTENKSNGSELDLYLVEPKLPVKQDLDILNHWKTQEYRFPNLARIARDILAIPISTVASESAFSIGGRILYQHRSSLTPENAEALVTTRDWLYGLGVDDLEVKTEEIVEDILVVEKQYTNLSTS